MKNKFYSLNLLIILCLSSVILFKIGTAHAETERFTFIVLFPKSVDIYSAAMTNEEAKEATNSLLALYKVDTSDIGYKSFLKSLNGFIAYMRESTASAIESAFPEASIKKDEILEDQRYKGTDGTLATSTTASDTTTPWHLKTFKRFIDWAQGQSPDYSKVVVFVMDSGCDLDHPDLQSCYDRNLDKDFVDSDDIADDCQGHGTEVAGVIASATTGICPDVTIVPLRIAFRNDSGGANARFSVMAEAADYICGLVDDNTLSGNHVIANLSYNSESPLRDTATEGYCNTIISNLASHDVLLFNSAGNYTLDVDSSWVYPSKMENENFISTAATEKDGAIASSFSNYGDHTVELAVPGYGIKTCLWADDESARTLCYITVSGTSFSSPIAAGIAAHIWALYPDLEPWQVRNLLINAIYDNFDGNNFIADYTGEKSDFLGLDGGIAVTSYYNNMEQEVIAGSNLYPQVIAGLSGPDPADCVSPSDGETGIKADNGITLKWSYDDKKDNFDDVDFNIYAGTVSNDMQELSGDYHGLEFEWDDISAGQDYYWRIDVIDKDSSETTKGNIWAFRTAAGNGSGGCTVKNVSPETLALFAPLMFLLKR